MDLAFQMGTPTENLKLLVEVIEDIQLKNNMPIDEIRFNFLTQECRIYFVEPESESASETHSQ